MKKNIKGALVATLICLLPIAVGLALYGRLPQQMPTHWNIHGQVDGYSSKAFAVFGLPLLLAGINLLVWFGLNSDPKRRNIGKAVWYIGLYTAPVVSVLMSSVTYLWALGYTQIPVDSVVMALVGVVFIAIGNYLPKTTKNTQGVAVMSLKKKAVLTDAQLLETSGIVNESRYRSKTIPSAGALLKAEDSPEKQTSFEV